MQHLLITDDQPAICDTIAGIAADEGYTVAQAADIRQTRIQIDRHKPDVMLLDVRLPDGDGIEFWKEACLPNTQVVFMTGHSSTRSEEHTSELQSLMRISYAVFCLNKNKKKKN